MTPDERIAELERRIAFLEGLITVQGGVIVLTRSTVINGRMNADRLYTQRSGSYVEITT